MNDVLDRLRAMATSPRDAAVPVALVVLTIFVFSQAASPAKFVQFTMIGIAVGAVYAISAAGLVLTYTTTGVFNFAHGAVGMLAAYLYFQLRVESGWPTPVAMVVVIGRRRSARRPRPRAHHADLQERRRRARRSPSPSR